MRSGTGWELADVKALFEMPKSSDEKLIADR